MNKRLILFLILLFSGCFGGGTRRTFILEVPTQCEETEAVSSKNIHVGSFSAPLFLDSTKIIIRKENYEISSFQESFWGEIPTNPIKRSIETSLKCLGAKMDPSSSLQITGNLKTLEIDVSGVTPIAKLEIEIIKKNSGSKQEKLFSFSSTLETGEISETAPKFNELLKKASDEIALWIVS